MATGCGQCYVLRRARAEAKFISSSQTCRSFCAALVFIMFCYVSLSLSRYNKGLPPFFLSLSLFLNNTISTSPCRHGPAWPGPRLATRHHQREFVFPTFFFKFVSSFSLFWRLCCCFFFFFFFLQPRDIIYNKYSRCNKLIDACSSSSRRPQQQWKDVVQNEALHILDEGETIYFIWVQSSCGLLASLRWWQGCKPLILCVLF